MTRDILASGGTTAPGVDGDEIGSSVAATVRDSADAVVSVDDGTVVFANDAVEDVFGYEASALVGEPLSAFVDEELDGSPTDGQTDLTGLHRDGREISLSVTFHEHEVGDKQLQTGIVRDAGAATPSESRTDHAARANEALRGVNEALVDASTRDELEADVCARLADDGPYEFAWVGAYDAGSEQVTPRASADGGEAYLEAVDDASGGDGLPHRAAATGETQCCQDIETDGVTPWREAALENDFRSAVSVPLEHEEAEYGVLTVYAGDPNAFSARERDSLADLGPTIADGITNVERKRTLLADTLTELEFEVSSADPLFFDGCGEGDWRLELRELVPSAGESLLAYLEVVGGDPEAVVAQAREADGVAEARVVSAHKDAGLVEVGTTGPTVIRQVTEAGANVHAASVDEGVGRFTTEVATESDVRTLVDAITDVAPDASLVAKREVERATETAPEFRQDLAEELTDRQQTVLQAAYQGGYFNWPRDSSGEDLADSLGIASSTFSQHLRAAERKLLSTFFDDTDREA